MGQKVNPVSFRLGITSTWNSFWYAKGGLFGDFLCQDEKMRRHVYKVLANAGVGKVVIGRTSKEIQVDINTARPGVVIGKKGAEIAALKKSLEKIAGTAVAIKATEIKAPELDARLVMESIARQISERVNYRRAAKKAIQSAMMMGAGGIKVRCSGRLAGAEIARAEWIREGSLPLHTLRADVDYASGKALTTYGCVGVKVWIYRKTKQPKESAKKS